MEQTRQWYYRGSLRSCNYSCSYCPFSKKSSSAKSLEVDRRQFFQFVERMEQLEEAKGAVQIVPYGEAMIHTYYWEGLARLSNLNKIEAVGAQSNFSFPVEKMLEYYKQQGGRIEKLRLWGTFHPEMTSVDQFVKQCAILSRWNVSYCVGVVGNPSRITEIRKLREQLDSSVYLWINKMNGLRRNYTQEEIAQFQEIDEYFSLELKHHAAAERICGNQIFVEADGYMKKCNLCRVGTYNLYEHLPSETRLACTRKECSCYLAYNNCEMKDLLFFYPYPAFRIPIYPKAVFLDVDGTLIPEGANRIPQRTCEQLRALAKHSDIYLATSLPLKDAAKKVEAVNDVIRGGVFAGGGRSIIYEKNGNEFRYDAIYPMDEEWIINAERMQKKYGFRMHTYQKSKQVYKVTLSFPKQKLLALENKETFFQGVIESLRFPTSCRWFIEENCIEIVRSDRGKLQGILEIMQEMGYRREEITVAGDSAEDKEMIEYFPFSVRVDKKGCYIKRL